MKVFGSLKCFRLTSSHLFMRYWYSGLCRSLTREKIVVVLDQVVDLFFITESLQLLVSSIDSHKFILGLDFCFLFVFSRYFIEFYWFYSFFYFQVFQIFQRFSLALVVIVKCCNSIGSLYSLSSLVLKGILLNFSVNALCAVPLNLCCGLGIFYYYLGTLWNPRILLLVLWYGSLRLLFFCWHNHYWNSYTF